MKDVFLGNLPGTAYARYFYQEEKEWEVRLATYTGADGAALFNSGMAAITTIARTLDFRSWDKLIISNCLYSQTSEFFRLLRDEEGIDVEFYGPTDEAFYQAASGSDVKLIFTEVIGNGFNMPVVDLQRLMCAIERNKAILVVDNTFLTPALYHVMPLAFAMDVKERVIGVESGTKYYQLGADEITLGLAYGPKDLIQKIRERRAILGTYLQPLCLSAIPDDIKMRQYKVMRQHSDKAQLLSKFLRDTYIESVVEEVIYPEAKNFLVEGCGGVFYFSLKGGPAVVEKFCDALQKCKIGGSFGHPDTWVIPIGLLQDNGVVRVAVGWQQPIEEVIEDFKQALEKLAP